MSKDIQKVALVDDHGLLNDMLAKIIGSFDGYSVILQASHGKELIDQLNTNNLHIIHQYTF
jgi:DNA-binding NarL/FixJ family response regulator